MLIYAQGVQVPKAKPLGVSFAQPGRSPKGKYTRGY